MAKKKAKKLKNLEKRLTFRVKDADFDLLQKIADTEGLKVSFLVRQLVLQYLRSTKNLLKAKSEAHGPK